MITEFLENLKDGNRLKEYVIDYYINNKYDINELLTNLKDLQYYGCISGMIPDLIYYDDTNRFYDNYKEEINELLSNLIDVTGLSIYELFGDKFDNTDPLVLDFPNKNLLAWFGFEEISNWIYKNVREKFGNMDNEFAY